MMGGRQYERSPESAAQRISPKKDPNGNHRGASAPPVPIFGPSSTQILYRAVHPPHAPLFQNSAPALLLLFGDNPAARCHPSSTRNKAGIFRDIVADTVRLGRRIHHPLLPSRLQKSLSRPLLALLPNLPGPFQRRLYLS